MIDLDELKALEVNVDEALQRFMGNTGLFERMIGKLPAAVKDNEVMPCFETGDFKGALEKAHTLKGVTGNLSVTPLYTNYSEIVNLLRADKHDEARTILENLLPVQEKIIACIEKR